MIGALGVVAIAIACWVFGPIPTDFDSLNGYFGGGCLYVALWAMSGLQ